MVTSRATFILGVAIMLCACSDSMTNPNSAPAEISQAFDLVELSDPDGSCADCHTMSAQQAATGGRASGHSEIFRGVIGFGSEEQVSFIALTTAPTPTSPFAAKGQLQGKGRADINGVITETSTHAEIDCLRIIGNVAWISGRVTRYVINGVDVVANFPGLQVFYKVQDNGEGGSTADAATPLLNDVSATSNLCAISDFPLFESVEGNIQVRQN